MDSERASFEKIRQIEMNVSEHNNLTKNYQKLSKIKLY